MPDESLETYWDEIRYRSPIRVVKDKPSELDDQLLLACEKASFDLRQQLAGMVGQPMNSDVIAKLVTTGIRQFMSHWKEGLTGQNLAGLIEIVLEGQGLTPDEMLGFVQALPESLIQRICKSAVGSASGVHGLMAIEYHRRRGTVSNLRVEASDGRVKVAFRGRGEGDTHFFLDDPFELDGMDP